MLILQVLLPLGSSAKNVAAQCSIIASNLQEEMESEASDAEPSSITSASENSTS